MVRPQLSMACERALLESARGFRSATRQQLRAAARRFVRRHRRDAGYLRWVLRSVGASSALALALLGLGAEPASANGTLLTPRTGAANPFQGVSPLAKATLADLDGDGDLDLATNGNPFRYFENTGSAASPAYVQRTGTANPLDGLGTTSFHFSPVFGDLDRDGDLDLLLPGLMAGVAYRYLENTGSATSPVFVERTGAQNPFVIPVPCCLGNATLGDIDGDGDLDLVSGFYNELGFLENTGSATSPAFVKRTGSANPFGALLGGYGYYTIPALGDIDRDGDLDLVVGHYTGAPYYFENTGSATSPRFVGRRDPFDGFFTAFSDYHIAPAFGDVDADGDLDVISSVLFSAPDLLYFENRAGELVARTGESNPLDGLDSGGFATLASGDLDGDGDPDLVSGSTDGTFRYFVNSSQFYLSTDLGIPNPLAGQDVGSRSAPALGDLDADGDLDLVAGEVGGALFYFENTGTAASAAFAPRTGSANPLDGEDVGGYSTPTLGDVDRDGDLDLLVGESSGAFFYFENTGSAASPAFVLRTGAANPLDGEDVGDRSTASLGDADSDGDLDLVAGDSGGTFAYFENTGSAASAAFVLRTGAADPLDGADVGTHSAPALGDLDGDSDLDLAVGESGNAFFYFENAIVRPSLSALVLAGGANPLVGLSADHYSTPVFGDLDADGDLDLVSGENLGTFAYFENTGSAVRPRFTQRTGASNPLNGLAVGALYSAPALGDLDADGDLDLVAGSYLGVFRYFENTGTATSPAFVASTGAQNPLEGSSLVDPHSTPALGDLDGDGDLDLVSGNQTLLELAWFENTGTATSPVFVARTGAQNPYEGLTVYHFSTPTLGDFDGDGDLDVFAGSYIGPIAWLENTGTATSPAFALRTGYQNPLWAVFDPPVSAPAQVDLDGDGDLDVVSGSVGGAFHTYYLPEPGTGLLLGAGLALLKVLERLRGRCATRPGRSASAQAPIRARQR